MCEKDSIFVLPGQTEEILEMCSSGKTILFTYTPGVFKDGMLPYFLRKKGMELFKILPEYNDGKEGFKKKYLNAFKGLEKGTIEKALSSDEYFLQIISDGETEGSTVIMLDEIEKSGEQEKIYNLIAKIFSMKLPYTLILNGSDTSSLPLGSRMFYNGIVEYSPESFRLNYTQTEEFLSLRNIPVNIIKKIYDYTKGDLSTLFIYLKEYEIKNEVAFEEFKRKIFEELEKTFSKNFSQSELDLITKLSLLKSQNIQTASNIIDLDIYLALMSKIRGNNLTFLLNEEVIDFYPFVKDFLRKRIESKYSAEEIVKIKLSYSEVLWKNRNFQPALQLVLETEDRELLDRILMDYVPDILQREDYRSFFELGSVMKNYADKEIFILNYILAFYYRLSGNVYASKSFADEIIKTGYNFGKKEEVLAIHFINLAMLNYLDIYKPEEALAITRHFEKEILNFNECSTNLVEWLSVHAFALKGEYHEARKIYYEVEKVLAAYPEYTNRDYYIPSIMNISDFLYSRSSNVLEEMLDKKYKKILHGDSGEFFSKPYLIHSAFLALKTGNIMKAKRKAEEALKIKGNDENNFSEILMDLIWGVLLLAEEKYEEAQIKLEKAGYLSERMGNSILIFKAKYNLVVCKLKMGNIPSAREILADLETNYSAYDNEYKVKILQGKGDLADNEEQGSIALECYETALRLAEKIKNWDLYINCLLSYIILLYKYEPEHQENTLSLLKGAIKTAKLHDCYYAFIEKKDLLPEILYWYEKAEGRDSLIWGIIFPDTDNNKGTYQSDLNIKVFGEFTISSNKGKLFEEDWPTKKVKGIFYYLLFKRGERIAREKLIDLFWPDIAETAQAHSNLRVSLSLMGKTLNKIGLKDILKRNRQKAWLEIPKEYIIDYYEAIDAYYLAKDSLQKNETVKAKEKLNKAMAIMDNSFLDTLIKEEWASEEIQKIQKYREQILLSLLKISLDENKLNKAEKYCRRLLEENKYREDIYLILANILKKKGNGGEAAIIYKQYKEMIKSELKKP